jgi:hypothetical protein
LFPARQSHYTFTCKCKLARATAQQSCLAVFNQTQCLAWHAECYGSETTRVLAEKTQTSWAEKRLNKKAT